MEHKQERPFIPTKPEAHIEERPEPTQRFRIEVLEARVAPVAIWGD